MEKRVLIAVLLSLLVLLLWGKLFPPPKPQPVPSTAQPAAQPPVNGTGSAPPSAGSPAQEQASGAVPAPMPISIVEESAEKREVLENEFVTLTFTNKGARVASVRLKKYQDSNRQPLELVPVFSTDDLPLDTVMEKAPDLQRTALSSLYKIEREGNSLMFTYASPPMEVSRRFTLERAFLQFQEVVRTAAPAEWGIRLGPGLRRLDSKETKNRFLLPGDMVYSKGETFARVPAGKVKEPLEISGEGMRYFGLEDNYFASIVLPRKGLGKIRAVQDKDTWRGGELKARPDLEALPEALRPRTTWDGASMTLSLRGIFSPEEQAEIIKVCRSETDVKRTNRIFPKDTIQLKVDATVSGTTLDATLYFGAKDYDFLKKEKPELTPLVNFGWFAFLAKPLLWCLKALNSVIHNYGLAIILLTIFLRVLLYPVNHKQMVSMKKMQDIQPKVEAIKRKYKKAPKDMEERNKMNQEVMALYKAEGVNPMGGCLPLLVQLPILWAFYNLLSAAIELRHAPFLFWIQDLSAKDPYYVTPILMGAAMFYQQKLTPTSGTDAQKKIFLLMPLMFTYLFLHFPSGLVLYWLVNTLLQLAQTMIYYRREKKETP
jgi:YidC/Oxa1 family membrane protein insertase